MTRPLLVLALGVLSFSSLQGCLMGGSEDEPVEVVRTDTLYVDTLHLRDTTWIMDTSSAIAGVWLLHRVEREWIEGGVAERDTVVIDTANPYVREFYVIRARSVSWSWYDPASNNSDVQTFRQLSDTVWLVGERDTVTVVRAANSLRLVFSNSYEGSSYRTDLFFVAYAGAFPPLEWAGVTAPPPTEVPENALVVEVDSDPESYSLSAGGVVWFRFEAMAGSKYLIRTFGSTDTYLELFNESAMLITENDDYEAEGAGLNAGIEWTASDAGDYWFRVTGYDNFETGDFSVSVTDITNGGGLGKPAATSSTEPNKRPVHLRHMPGHEAPGVPH